MYFDLTDEQKAIRESLHSYLLDKLDGPRTIGLFDSGALDTELWHGLMGLGLGSVLIPASLGGSGLDMLTLAVIAETLGHYAVPCPVLSNALAGWLIATSNDAPAQHRWLESLSSGHAIASFALLEGESSWLASQWELDGNRLSGIKRCVEWGGTADLLIVGLRGARFALVDTKAAGIEVSPRSSLDRTRPLAEIKFTDVECSILHSATVAEECVDALLILLAADACGAAHRAYDMSVQYAQTRSQFGQVIGKFQALKHQLANMAIDIEPCRALYWYAAHAWDTMQDKRQRAAATAKAHIGDCAVRTARAAVEAHGGIGYTWDYPLHVYLKRAMHSRSAMALPVVHRERVAALAEW
jgi:alkylation response protein AidB-like acyl-CoA dehydrogenase